MKNLNVNSTHAEAPLRALLGSIFAESTPLHNFMRDFKFEIGQRSSPFVTISRQAGAGAKRLAEQLAERLNRLDDGGVPWTSWDRELVEKVASDNHFSCNLIETLTEHSRSWLEQFFADFGSSIDPSTPDDFRIYRRVAQTIRALAQRGHVIIVGRGGMCITRDMPGGLHVRLAAPVKHRVGEVARRYSMRIGEAEKFVRDLDRGREDFYRHYFPDVVFSPEQFCVTFNTSVLSEQQILDAMVAILSSKVPSKLTETPVAVASGKTQ
ncbi:cytidylate kinase-like family protein [soil metagenome]